MSGEKIAYKTIRKTTGVISRSWRSLDVTLGRGVAVEGERNKREAGGGGAYKGGGIRRSAPCRLFDGG